MTTPAGPLHVTSRDNPLLQRLRKLARDAAAYRDGGQAWIEGEHLCAALHGHGGRAAVAVLSEAAWARPQLQALATMAARTVIVADALWHGISSLPSPALLGCVVDVAPDVGIDADAPSIVLDRVQDPGNVGSILRSAAAFGVAQVLALQGSAALWSPKVLRAGMGAHFGLRLVESLDASALVALRSPLVATSSHAGVLLPTAQLPSRCVWVLGHEGQGVAPALLARCALQVRIPQPGGEESLNVAAAAAVCLYESARRASAQ